MTSDAQKALQAAAIEMAKRLTVWKKLFLYHQEVHDETVTLPISDLWNAGDQAALDKFETAVHTINGARPLPFEE